jgi:signal transduction histidine kinase
MAGAARTAATMAPSGASTAADTADGARERRLFAIAAATAIALCALFAAWTAGRWGGAHATVIFDDAVMTLTPLAAGLLCIRRARRDAGRPARFWALLAASHLAFAAGMLYWDTAQLAMRVAVPYPSPGDIGFLAGIPLTGAAVYLWPGAAAPDAARARVILDGAVVTAALFFVTWALALEPIYHAGGQPTLAKVVGVAYPAGFMAVLAALILTVAHTPVRGFAAAPLVAASIVCLTVVNVPYAVMCIQGTYATGHAIDVLWIMAFCLAALAALEPASDGAAPGRARAASWRIVQIALPSAPVVLAGLVAVARLIDDRPFGAVLAVSAFAVLGLMLARQHLTVAELTRVAAENAARHRALAEANQRIREADRQKDLFLANMSHELRTPLNSIIGFSELLIDRVRPGEPLDDKQRRFLKHIHGSGHHLLTLINDILDLAKIEAGKLELARERLDARSLCDGLLQVMKGQADRRRVSLGLDAPDDLPLITADPVRLKQVLYNLLANAVKFSPEGGEVSLSVRALPAEASPLGVESLRFDVDDRGVGIDPRHHELIFAPFRQVQDGATPHPGGTGLGLPLVRRFVELHGGTVQVDSALGEGSTFTVFLPVRRT